MNTCLFNSLMFCCWFECRFNLVFTPCVSCRKSCRKV